MKYILLTQFKTDKNVADRKKDQISSVNYFCIKLPEYASEDEYE